MLDINQRLAIIQEAFIQEKGLNHDKNLEFYVSLIYPIHSFFSPHEEIKSTGKGNYIDKYKIQYKCHFSLKLSHLI